MSPQPELSHPLDPAFPYHYLRILARQFIESGPAEALHAFTQALRMRVD